MYFKLVHGGSVFTIATTINAIASTSFHVILSGLQCQKAQHHTKNLFFNGVKMATIVMESAKVIEAAKATIESILAVRVRRDEQAIANVMAYKRGWFKKYFPTREQAVKILDEGNMFGWRSQKGWGDEAHARKLLTLAKHGDPVTLNEEDTRVLF